MKTASAVTNKSNDRATRLGVWFFVVASCWTILIVVLGRVGLLGGLLGCVGDCAIHGWRQY